MEPRFVDHHHQQRRYQAASPRPHPLLLALFLFHLPDVWVLSKPPAHT